MWVTLEVELLNAIDEAMGEQVKPAAPLCDLKVKRCQSQALETPEDDACGKQELELGGDD